MLARSRTLMTSSLPRSLMSCCMRYGCMGASYRSPSTARANGERRCERRTIVIILLVKPSLCQGRSHLDLDGGQEVDERTWHVICCGHCGLASWPEGARD